MSVRVASYAVIVEEGKILLIRFRNPESGLVHWHFLGGGVGEGETMEESLLREAYEEAGVELEIVRYIGLQERTEKHERHYYFCRRRGQELTLLKQPDEYEKSSILGFHWVDLQDESQFDDFINRIFSFFDQELGTEWRVGDPAGAVFG
ncbi:MAG TPA: NUDIX domain-containing protein [Bacilli bacterium]|nr:NUDIX domain-containing protein [Bacilli bacterium]